MDYQRRYLDYSLLRFQDLILLMYFYLDRTCFKQQPSSLSHPSILPCCVKSIWPALWLIILLWDLPSLWDVLSAGWSYTLTGRLSFWTSPTLHATSHLSVDKPQTVRRNVRNDSCMVWPRTASKPWDKPQSTSNRLDDSGCIFTHSNMAGADSRTLSAEPIQGHRTR